MCIGTSWRIGEQMITCNIVGSKLITKLPTNRINGYNLDKHLLKARVCYTVVLPLWCLFCSRRNGATADIFSGGVNLSSACRIGHLDRPCLPKGIIARLFSTGRSMQAAQTKERTTPVCKFREISSACASES